ncbi:hypothetical protein HPB49_021327 [Dermacentor silvarum]|uniref:Uncharacterized protein n=1 Tax=Dermacentor silvarum TaxID=543639 RepID=A0ACB8DFW2_DERSI|nr:hypothetical protein HPB49_021327 [Dermacentor silvarum]
MANGDERSAYNERLIDAVEHERALWDLRDRNYKSRPVCDAAWRHVAAVMVSTVAEVKARWKNLRDTFRRVLKDRAGASKSSHEVPCPERHVLPCLWCHCSQFQTCLGNPRSQEDST